MERVIQAEHVRAAIMKPDFSKQSFDGRTEAYKVLADGREITVIYAKNNFKGTNDCYIITAYYN